MAHYQCDNCGKVHGGPCEGMERKMTREPPKAPEFGDRRVTVNDTQVGGTHYKSTYQHWDFVIKHGLHYLLGCASKYVTRRKGNRKEDLNKAIHYLQKAEEVGITARSIPSGDTFDDTSKFCAANGLTHREFLCINAMIGGNYSKAIEHIQKMLAE